MFKGLHAKQEKSRLSQIPNLIDWTPFRQILEELYDNKSEKSGRPNSDVIMMFKILILQKWYGFEAIWKLKDKWLTAYHLWRFLIIQILSQTPERYGSNNA
jgi:hypothetical protein